MKMPRHLNLGILSCRLSWQFSNIARSRFLVRIRNAGEEVHDKEAAWNALQICPEPEDPNFHQVAGLLAYGPLALGKGQHCPRDGLLDCSIVDALEATSCLDLLVFLHLEIRPNIDSVNFKVFCAFLR